MLEYYYYYYSFVMLRKRAIVNNKIQSTLTLEIFYIFLYGENLLEPLVEIW